MNWQLRAGTQNRKLGHSTYVVSLSSDTCPDSCPLKSAGCYAKQGHLRVHWNRVDRGEAKHDPKVGRWAGRGFNDLAATLRAEVRPGHLLRIGDMGDPSENGVVPAVLIEALGELALRGVRSIVYTHAPRSLNSFAIDLAKSLGVALNFSTHGTSLDVSILGSTVTTVTPEHWTLPGTAGAQDGLLRCPAETSDVTCDSCGLCARPNRAYAIGFTAHGSQKRRVAEVSA